MKTSKTLRLFIVAVMLLSSVGLPSGRALAAEEQELFSSSNIYRVENGPTAAMTFKADQLWLVTYLMTYHYNGGAGATPGTLALRHEDGTMYGPWQATGGPDPAVNPTNMYWVCRPNFVIKPGVYTVVDSDPATWAWNAGAAGGMTVLKGRLVAEAPNQPVKPPRVTQEPATAPTAAADVLVSKTLEPSSTSQLVVYKDEVGVIIPGGTLESKQAVTISPAPSLPEKPSKAFTQLAAYDISMGDLREFKNPLVIEIAYDPSKIRSDMTPDKALGVAWWDASRKVWVNAPFAVDTTRNVVMIPTTHLTIWEVVALAKGWQLYPRAQEHFKIYYDPAVQMKVGENSGDYILDVSHALEAAYASYEGAGYNMALTFVPASAIGSVLGALGGGMLGTAGGAAVGGPGGALVAGRAGANAAGRIGAVIGTFLASCQTYVIIDKDTQAAEWNKKGTGEIYVPLNFDSLPQLYHDMAHEFFHAVQNGYFSTGASAAAAYAGIDRLWLLEATADYAPVAHGLSRPELLEKIPPAYFQAPLQAESAAGFKERFYITARFIEYLEKRGYSFKTVWDGISTTATVIGATPSMQKKLELYFQQSGMALHELYGDFAANAFFNSDSPLDIAKGKTLEESGAVIYAKTFPAADPALVYDMKLPANYTATLSRINVEFKDDRTERPIKLMASAVSEKDKVTVSAFVLPGDKRVPGGVTPKPVPLYSEGGRLTSLTLRKNETLYLMAVNSQATDVTLSLKITDGSLVISPAKASVDAGESVTFTTPGVTEKVLWNVQEGASGGTLGSDGSYTAPAKAGTYHVVATLDSDRTITATATVETSTPVVQDAGEYLGKWVLDKVTKEELKDFWDPTYFPAHNSTLDEAGASTQFTYLDHGYDGRGGTFPNEELHNKFKYSWNKPKPEIFVYKSQGMIKDPKALVKISGRVENAGTTFEPPGYRDMKYAPFKHTDARISVDVSANMKEKIGENAASILWDRDPGLSRSTGSFTYEAVLFAPYIADPTAPAPTMEITVSLGCLSGTWGQVHYIYKWSADIASPAKTIPPASVTA